MDMHLSDFQARHDRTASYRANPAKPSGEDIACVQDLADLTRIYAPAVQLCYLPRLPDARIQGYLQAASSRLASGLRQVTDIAAGPPRAALPDLPGRDAFAEDIALLMAVYGDLLDCPRVVLRLEVIRQAMCPRFHVDRTGIRLLCTYRGPGTQWLAESHARRDRLGHGAGGLPDEQSGLIVDAEGIGDVPPFAIALLKGELWQGNAGRGAIHRSPQLAATEAPRVLLALDAVWD